MKHMLPSNIRSRVSLNVSILAQFATGLLAKTQSVLVHHVKYDGITRVMFKNDDF